MKMQMSTDNQVVLGYIRNEVQRFNNFVANRVQFIGEITKVQQ